MSAVLQEIVAKNRAGYRTAVPSVCSSHPDVIDASLMLAFEIGHPIAIEATSNQVNQFGGYTGQTPMQFAQHVRERCQHYGGSMDNIVLGGDHLGPQAWKSEPVEAAMNKASEMITAYVQAGFTKIHLDCSEGCQGEPLQLDDAVTAERSASLAKVALNACNAPETLTFVIGTEVPPPGGARTEEDGTIPATSPEAARATLTAHQEAFSRAGIGSAFQQVSGLVVQPGVEFGPMSVHHFPVDRDPCLIEALDAWPNICLEAHSTDYQNADVYPRLAELGFAYQKVGPALTYAWREAVYSIDLFIAAIEEKTPNLIGLMDAIMIEKTEAWSKHYSDEYGDLRYQRHFGLADRIRYFWPDPRAVRAVQELFLEFENLAPPKTALRQVFVPEILDRADRFSGMTRAKALCFASIQHALLPYFFSPATLETGS